MTAVHLRTAPDSSVPTSGLLLDWFGRGGASTLSGRLEDLTRGFGSADASFEDLLRIAVAVFGADKLVLRASQPDLWSRPLRLHVPVRERDRWRRSSETLAAALRFLSNDDWAFSFRTDASSLEETPMPDEVPEAVTLFSGGLDSLVGAIDLLEDGKRVALVGHYDSNLLVPRQQYLAGRLSGIYGSNKVFFRPFYLRPIGARAAQARPLSGVRESTTRSRSFLFIAAGGLTASSLSLNELQVPENGYVGLNVPLEPSRLGALSTRTTHPHFFSLLRTALEEATLPLEVANPYELRTKAEVIMGCRNRDLLHDLVPDTISCAHPEVGRWSEEGYGNCGYCYPCLMRRVALHQIDADDAQAYRVDVGDPSFLGASGARADHLRALIDSSSRPISAADVLRSGPIPRGKVSDFGDLYLRGQDEIRVWLDESVPGWR